MSQIPKAIGIYMAAMLLMVVTGACVQAAGGEAKGLWVVAGLIGFFGAAAIFMLFLFEDENLRYLKPDESKPELDRELVRKVIKEELEAMTANFEADTQHHTASGDGKVGDLTK